jgi:pyruvate/2-oxoglutarate/acetoin dehydrogenase E1 component
LTVVCGSHRHDNGALLENASRFWPNPVLFLEHKLLYGLKQEAGDFRISAPAEGDPGADLFPTLVTGPETADVTLLTYGGMTPVVEEAVIALAAEELTCEVVVPSLLAPLPRHSLIRQLKNRKRIVIAEESHEAFGVGAEIAASLLEAGFRGQLARVGAASVAIPSARSLEASVLPGRDDVVKAVLSMF